MSAWLIYFEDHEVRPEIFTGENAEEAARCRFIAISDNWNAHLFECVKSNCGTGEYARQDVTRVGLSSEPTEAMLQEGVRAYEDYLDRCYRAPPLLQINAMRAAYRAMFAAPVSSSSGLRPPPGFVDEPCFACDGVGQERTPHTGAGFTGRPCWACKGSKIQRVKRNADSGGLKQEPKE